MTATEYLEQYRDATKLVMRAREEYDREMEMINTIRSPLAGDGLPRSGEISRKVEQDAIRLEEKARELLAVEVPALKLRQQIVSTIQKVSSPAADVLMERFVNLTENGRMQTWKSVADKVGYSEENVYRLRIKGLDEVEKLINIKSLQ